MRSFFLGVITLIGHGCKEGLDSAHFMDASLIAVFVSGLQLARQLVGARVLELCVWFSSIRRSSANLFSECLSTSEFRVNIHV